MLLEFSVRNFLSFMDKQTLSLVASASRDHLETNCIEGIGKGCPRILRSAIIQGANASGKSNLIAAIRTMQSLVLTSYRRMENEEVRPFLLDSRCKNAPSEFEIIFLSEGVRYQYGFVIDKERVYREWLISSPEGRPQRWFERFYQKSSDQYKWNFSEKLRGQKTIYKKTTRPGALLLSTATHLNNRQLLPVFNWFAHNLCVLDHKNMYLGDTIERCQNDRGKAEVLMLLNTADLGILDITIEEREVMEAIKRKHIPQKLHQLLTTEAFLRHGTDSLFFDQPLDKNSGGTKKIFSMASLVLDVFKKSTTLIVDELNNSVHPLLLRFLIRLFHSGNRGNAQLIFAGHDVSVLDAELFRRDQVWFIERNKVFASKLYSLKDFQVKKIEAIGENYLAGKYGGIPFQKESLLQG